MNYNYKKRLLRMIVRIILAALSSTFIMFLIALFVGLIYQTNGFWVCVIHFLKRPEAILASVCSTIVLASIFIMLDLVSSMELSLASNKNSLIQSIDQIKNSLSIHESQVNNLLKSYDDKIDKRIDKHFQNAKIVFETGIKDYDNDHLLALQKILNELELKDVKTIYLVDHSDPIQWWSESMTGYLSLLAKWRANEQKRRVHRIFIFSKNELISPITVKTLAFHSLLGFNTYVFEENQYKALFSKYTSDIKIGGSLKMKELFMWSQPSSENPISVNLKMDINSWSNIILYQSYWCINEHSKVDRKRYMENDEHLWFDHKGQEKKSKDIQIWFDFTEGKDDAFQVADEHLKFIKYLRSRTICCKKVDHLHGVNSSDNFGIEIKTMACVHCGLFKNNGSKFDPNKCKAQKKDDEKFEYTSSKKIRELLSKYSELV